MSLRRHIQHVPSRGWVRFRHWLGVPNERIVEEVEGLHLPGYRDPALVVSGVLTGVPRPPIAPHLKVLPGGADTPPGDKKKPKPAKGQKQKAVKDPRKRLVEAYSAGQTTDTYAAENRLDYYAETVGGRQSARNALELWCEGGELREIALDALLAGDSPKEVAELLRRYAPPAKRPWLRNVDVQAFRDLFWDFRGWGPPQVAAFIIDHPVSAHGPVALTLGTNAVLQRMGKLENPYSMATAKGLVEQTLMGWLQFQSLRPESADIFKLKTAVDVMERLRDLGAKPAGGARPGDNGDFIEGDTGEATAYGTLLSIGVRVSQVPPIPSLQELMAEATSAQRQDDLERARALGALTAEEYSDLSAKVLTGVDIGPTLRNKIAEVQSDMTNLEDPLVPIALRNR